MNRRGFMAAIGAFAGSTLAENIRRPNILFCIADDWGWPHASIHGDTVVQTPTFDRIARNGILFNNAFAIVPSCTPSRNSILTGQYPWRLKTGASLWSVFPEGIETYPNLLEDAGYHVGCYRKAYGPGVDRSRPVAGTKYKNVDAFFKARPEGKPFCFWFGTSDPHRGYEWQSGIRSGMKLEDVEVPPYLPDTDIVRTDICDYYFEVQRFDREVGEVLQRLEQSGELDHTLVMMTGDHGWPFPRAKANLYGAGTHVCLAAQWGHRIKPGRVVEDFVSFHDFAPSFLEAAGLQPLEVMTGRSLMNIFNSPQSGQIEPQRDHVVLGKERHTPCQPDDTSGTPMRAIRTKDFLYIRNFKPDCWPAGAPVAKYKDAYFDIDGGPTKKEIVENKDAPEIQKLFELSMGKRPADELYDVRKDPFEIENLAGNPEYAARLKKLEDRLFQALEESDDPRMKGQGDLFDGYKYHGATKLGKGT